MFCPKCGKENADGAGFCDSCGAPLKKEITATPVTATPTATAQKSVKKNGRLIGIAAAVVVVIVVIAGIATGGFGLFGSGVAVKSSTEAYTWEELSVISEEIGKASSEEAAVEVAKKYNLTNSNGQLDGTQVKNVQLSNGQTTQVQIAGFRHDDKASGGKAGITFIFKDAIAECSMNSSGTSAGGWENSQMRSWLATDGMNMLPSELSGKIVEVNKMTNNTGETTSVASVTSTSDKLWLFSSTELCGTISWFSDSNFYGSYVGCNDVLNAEGTEYKLFRDQADSSTSGNSILTKTYNGSSCYWWERSADPTYPDYFEAVSPDGEPWCSIFPSHSSAVVPGFCI